MVFILALNKNKIKKVIKHKTSRTVYPPLSSRCLYLRCTAYSPYQKAACWIKRFPLCHFPYAKYSEEAARLQPDGVCIG